MKLIGYELLKIWNKKVFLVVILCCIIGNGFVFFNEQNTRKSILIENKRQFEKLEKEYAKLSPDEARIALDHINKQLSRFSMARSALEIPELYSMYVDSGDLTEADIKQFQDSKYANDFELQRTDQYFIRLLNDQYTHLEQYEQYIDDMEAKVDQMLKVSIFQKPNTYAYRNIMTTMEAFENHKDITLTSGPKEGLLAVTSHSLNDLLMIIFMLALCYYLFQYEKDSKLLFLLRTNRKGRVQTIISKLIVYISVLSAMFVVLYGSIYAIANQLYGFGDLDRLIQGVEGLSRGQLLLTVAQFLISYALVKWLVYLLFALILAALFIGIGHIGKLVMWIIVGTVLELMAYSFIHPYSQFGLFKFINIFYAIQGDVLLTVYRNINLFGYPIPTLQVITVVIMILVIALLIFSIMMYTLRYPNPNPTFWLSVWWSKIRERLIRPTSSQHLLQHEWFKILFTAKGYVIIVLALIFCYFNIQQQPITEDDTRASYMKYLNQFNGKLTDDLIGQIEAEKIRLEQIPAQLTDLKQSFDSEIITQQQYNEERFALENELNQSSGFDYLYNQVQNLQIVGQQTDGTVHLMNSYAGKYLFGHEFRIELQGFFYLLLLLMIVSPIVTIDYRTNSIQLLRSTKQGRAKLMLSKHIVSYILAVLIYLIIYIPSYYNLMKYYPHFHWDAPIQSVEMYAQLPLSLTIWQYVLFTTLLQGIATLVIIECIFYLSHLLKKQALVLVTSSAIVIVPFIVQLAGGDAIQNISLNRVILISLSMITNSQITLYMIVVCIIGLAFAWGVWSRERTVSIKEGTIKLWS